MVILVVGQKDYPLDEKTKNVLTWIGDRETLEGPKEKIPLDHLNE